MLSLSMVPNPATTCICICVFTVYDSFSKDEVSSAHAVQMHRELGLMPYFDSVHQTLVQYIVALMSAKGY